MQIGVIVIGKSNIDTSVRIPGRSNFERRPVAIICCQTEVVSTRCLQILSAGIPDIIPAVVSLFEIPFRRASAHKTGVPVRPVMNALRSQAIILGLIHHGHLVYYCGKIVSTPAFTPS